MTETEKRFIENDNTDIGTSMLLRAIASLRDEVSELKGTVTASTGKTDEDRKQEILSMKDVRKRLKAIEENLDLWK